MMQSALKGLFICQKLIFTTFVKSRSCTFLRLTLVFVVDENLLEKYPRRSIWQTNETIVEQN